MLLGGNIDKFHIQRQGFALQHLKPLLRIARMQHLGTIKAWNETEEYFFLCDNMSDICYRLDSCVPNDFRILQKSIRLHDMPDTP